jgi:hypothetical protein
LNLLIVFFGFIDNYNLALYVPRFILDCIDYIVILLFKGFELLLKKGESREWGMGNGGRRPYGSWLLFL